MTLRATSGAVTAPANTCEGCALRFGNADELEAHRAKWHCHACGALYPHEASPACHQCGTRRDERES